MKLKYLYFILFCLLGCDPIYNCYLVNDTPNELNVKISPPIEELFLGDYKDKLANLRINGNDSFALYKIPANSEIKLLNSIGVIPKENELPIQLIEIYSEDTLLLDTRQKIISALKKTNTREYKIIVNE